MTAAPKPLTDVRQPRWTLRLLLPLAVLGLLAFCGGGGGSSPATGGSGGTGGGGGTTVNTATWLVDAPLLLVTTA